MKNYQLKFKPIAILFAIWFLSMQSFGQVNKKETRLKEHLNVVSLLQEVKTYASSIQNHTKDWEGNDLIQMKKLYLELQIADADLISRYQVIIKNYRKAKKEKMSIKDEMEKLEKANNSFVKYFYDHMNDHPNKSGVGIWGEIIEIVFEAGKQIYDFVDGINEKVKDKYLSDISDKFIPNWGEINSSKKESNSDIPKKDKAKSQKSQE